MPVYESFTSNISIDGPGLLSAETGQPASFYVYNSSGGGGVLSVAFEGPSKPTHTIKRLEDGTKEVTYIAKVPGHYEIDVFYQNNHVPGSPCFVHVSGEPPKADIPKPLEESIEKIKVYGKNLEYGKPLALNKVVIDCREAGIDQKELIVSMNNPRRRASIIKLDDNQDGTYALTYKPTDAGTYQLNVEVLDRHVPGSPFKIRVPSGSIS